MSFEKFLLVVAIPAVLLFSSIEAVLLSRHQHYDWRAFGVSFFDFVLRIVVSIVLPVSIAAPLISWVQDHRIAAIQLDSVGAVLLLFLLLDFFYYWLHRAAHRLRWFWANHAVHHSSNQLNLMAALRIGAFGKLSGNVVFLLPMVWLGFDLGVVLSALTLNLLVGQFWIHATWIPKLGWLEYVLNTPSSHRVHHAANAEYLDANYGGVLIVFDRLFGTYIAERDDLPCRYGLVHPITSYNPLYVEFAHWLSLARDIRKARSVRALLGYLFMPPGWSPNGNGDTTEELRARQAQTSVISTAGRP
jgi:sterol desaturase/sphingolipid hydroxylase (fatty acid hydroxylase superfamily)